MGADALKCSKTFTYVVQHLPWNSSSPEVVYPLIRIPLFCVYFRACVDVGVSEGEGKIGHISEHSAFHYPFYVPVF